MSGEGWSSEYDFLRQSMLNTNQTMTSKFSACLKSMAGQKLSEKRNILRLSMKSAMTLNATKRRRKKRKREDARQGTRSLLARPMICVPRVGRAVVQQTNISNNRS